MKNLTRIGTSLLGTWTAQTQLSTPQGDTMTAFFVAHFMPDPRRAHGCSLINCSEVDNNVCMVHYESANKLPNKCHDIAREKDVAWSDVTAFFNFGIKIESKSSPKAKFEMHTGDWVGPWNLIMAQDTHSISLKENNMLYDVNNNTSTTLVDKYVSRYVQSQSVSPSFWQNLPPTECTLYNKADDWTCFLGSSSLEYMTAVQTNLSIANSTNRQPDIYAPYLQTCQHGNVQPTLPLVELEFRNFNSNSTINATNNTDNNKLKMALKFQYKIMAVPTPDEQAYRLLPQLQSKFQGHGEYNILSGPYCYGDDPHRGYSFDLNFNTAEQQSTEKSNTDKQKLGQSFLIRGCVDGYPCVPRAAMGQIPMVPSHNDTCDKKDHHDKHSDDGHHPGVGLTTMLLSFGCYFFTITTLISATFNCHLSHKFQQATKKQKEREAAMMNDDFFAAALMTEDHPLHGRDRADTPKEIEYLGENNVGPFGDLVQASGDPLQEPLLRDN